MAIDLRTTWLGLDLSSPVTAGAGPLTGSLDSLLELEESGAAAVVLPSLFEEQIEHEEMTVAGLYEDPSGISPEAGSYFPELMGYNAGPERYLENLRAAREALGIPVVASLNGHSPGGWVRYAELLEGNGAHALELNVYYVPTDPEENSIAVEDRYLRIVSEVRTHLTIPLSVKLGPYFSALPHMVRKLEEAGADGVVLFNRFLYPDFRITEDIEVVPSLELSHPSEARLPLRWIAVIKDRIPVSIAASSGVEGPDEVVKLILAGADVVQSVSALLRHGPGHVGRLRDGLTAWMQETGYTSVTQMSGSLCQGRAPDPEAFARANYMKALTDYTSRFIP